MARKIVGIKIIDFTMKVIKPNLLCVIAGLLLALPFHYILKESFLRIVIVSLSYLLGYLIIAWHLVFDTQIKKMILSYKDKLLRK